MNANRQTPSARSRAALRHASGVVVDALEVRSLFSSATLGSSGLLQIRGTDAADTIAVSREADRVLVSLNGSERTFPADEVRRLRVWAHGGDDTVTLNTSLRSTVHAGEGNDTVWGGRGRDVINGDAGFDWLSGRNGNDTVRGGEGADTLSGGKRSDRLFGEEGNDLIFGAFADSANFPDDTADAIEGGAGDDTLSGDGGSDSLHGGDGNDEIWGGNAAGSVFAEDDDSIEGGAGNDLINGGSGNDSAFGGDGDDNIDGGDGSDALFAGAGNDSVYGRGGDDSLDGGGGDDWMDAGSSGEFVAGGSGTDFSAWDWAVRGATIDDVAQQQAGTCVFLSVLAEVAFAGLANLEKQISYRGDFNYAVQLYLNGWQTVNVRFDGSMVRYGGGTMDPAALSQGDSLNEFWTILYQRAYLQLCHGIAQTDAAGVNAFPGEFNGITAFRALSGRNGWTYSPASIDPSALQTRLRAGYGVVAATPGNGKKVVGELVTSHSYSVTGVESVGGNWVVTVRNPWGEDGGTITTGNPYDGYIQLSWSAFARSFSSGTIA